ncbi:hypothetical protein DFH09DRAFT_1097114 [Mycena vulgaris]|nr:hypothetical protein DFH09DRAFT_1097114 [Mycena vulgaris]
MTRLIRSVMLSLLCCPSFCRPPPLFLTAGAAKIMSIRRITQGCAILAQVAFNLAQSSKTALRLTTLAMAPAAEPKAKPRRNRLPAAKLSDGNNGEAPSAIHQQVLATKPILDLIKKMKKPTAQFPEAIPLASDADDIVRVITTIHGIDNSVRGTFNRRFDILFGEDCRDDDGRLKNIRRGDVEMPCVLNYLESIHWESAEIPLDLAGIKLKRIVDELELLCTENAPPATTQGKKNQPRNTTDEQPAAASHEPEDQPLDAPEEGLPSKGPGWDRMMDRVFAAATTTGNKKRDEEPYKPRRKNPNLSEESDDDFDMDELDQPAPPLNIILYPLTGKRKLVVIDSEEETEPATPPVPLKKGSKTAAANAKNTTTTSAPGKKATKSKLS